MAGMIVDLTYLAIPVKFSDVTGFFLWGMLEDPF